jgi:hypothetical protein
MIVGIFDQYLLENTHDHENGRNKLTGIAERADARVG